MANTYSLSNLSQQEGKELLAGISARRKALDKVFKAAAKEELQQAMDKIHDRIRALTTVEDKVKEMLSEEK